MAPNPQILPYQDGSSAGYIDRAQEMRRDNDIVKVPKITLYDIDYAIYYHLTEALKIKVTENNVSIPVPVMFSSGEKWSQIRQHGYMRDKDRKVLAPAIIIRRTNITDDTRFAFNSGRLWTNQTFSPKTKLIPYKTSNMVYDRIAGQYVSKDSYEFYLIDIPDYVRINYELIIWTDLIEQMNVIVQQLIGVSNHVWGDFYKFRTVVQDYTHDNVNVPGEDRLIKTTVTLQVDGYLRNEYEYQQSKIQKGYTIKRVHFLNESTDQILYDQINDLQQPNLQKSINMANSADQDRNLRRDLL